ncbi:MAG: hypothetical protein ACOYLX_23545, partial [Burkholderiaceae bacterium]
PAITRLRDAIGTRFGAQLYLWDDASSPFDSTAKAQRMLVVLDVATQGRPYAPGELRFRDDRMQHLGAEEVSDLL